MEALGTGREDQGVRGMGEAEGRRPPSSLHISRSPHCFASTQGGTNARSRPAGACPGDSSRGVETMRGAARGLAEHCRAVFHEELAAPAASPAAPSYSSSARDRPTSSANTTSPRAWVAARRRKGSLPVGDGEGEPDEWSDLARRRACGRRIRKGGHVEVPCGSRRLRHHPLVPVSQDYPEVQGKISCDTRERRTFSRRRRRQ